MLLPTYINNRNRGAALITILVLSACSLVFLLATAGIVSQAIKTTNKPKWQRELRTVADMGLDYVIKQYALSPNACELDPLPGKTQSIVSLPASITSAIPTGTTLSVVVKTLSTTDDFAGLKAYSSIYNQQLDPASNTPVKFPSALSTNFDLQGGGYRIVESTVTRNGVSKTIRSVLVAQLQTGLTKDAVAAGVSKGQTPQSYFSKPFFSNGQITFNPAGKLIVQGDSGESSQGSAPNQFYSYNLAVSTNVLASINGNTDIKGDVIVASNGSGSNFTASIGGSSQIEGRLVSNGDFSSSVQATSGAAASGSDNILANADSAGTGTPGAPRSGINASTPGESGASLSQYAMEPAIQGNNAASIPKGTNLTFGDFTTNGLNSNNIAPNTSVWSGNPSVNPNGDPTRVFLSDNSNGSVGVDAGLLNTPTAPNNFQIWYSGNQPINVSLAAGKPFNGLIYAPYSTVTLSGTGDFNGGIVAGSINANNTGNITITNKLSDSNSVSSNAPNSKLQYFATGNNKAAIEKWVPVTWQEVN